MNPRERENWVVEVGKGTNRCLSCNPFSPGDPELDCITRILHPSRWRIFRKPLTANSPDRTAPDQDHNTLLYDELITSSISFTIFLIFCALFSFIEYLSPTVSPPHLFPSFSLSRNVFFIRLRCWFWPWDHHIWCRRT